MSRFILSAVIAAAMPLFPFTANAKHIYKIESSLFSSMSSEVKIIDEIPQLGIIITEQPVSLQRGIKSLGEVSEVQIVQPFASEKKLIWGLSAINAPEAWLISKGEGALVAVSDTGIDSDHPELQENMWHNPGEIPGNNIDDDQNGYVDDIHGWNFVKNKPATGDNQYHGTHVAGTIAARAGVKVTGVAPKAKLMDVSFLNSKGSGSDVNGAKSIIYAADNGAKIINCSWGASGKNKLIEEAIKYAENKGVLIVAAAGNAQTNTDRKAFFPAGVPATNVLSVGATSNASGSKASFSNWGQNTVDLAAPGSGILSTYPSSSNKSKYQTLSGTSMASPHVAGVAALILGQYPYLNAVQIKEKIMLNAVGAKAWNKKSVTGGVLNARKSLE